MSAVVRERMGGVARRSNRMVGVVVSACMAGAAGTAQAQTSSGRESPRALEEIIVTAQKQNERLQDVPVPVTVLAAEALAEVNQLRVQDYYHSIPGVALNVSGNGAQPLLTIRGITTGGDTNPTVGIVVDDVSYGTSVATGGQTPAVVDIDPGDLAQVEVLRGPQGTLYGASSIGGLLKFVTIDPSTEAVSGRVQVGSSSVKDGDDLGYSARGSINLPLSDTFALRASGFTIRDPGYIDNAETGERDINERDSDGGRLSALWRPSEDFSLKLSALYQDSQRRGSSDVDTALGSNPQQALLGGSGIYDRTSEAYSATAIGNIGGVELVSATGYSVDELADDIDLTLLGGGALASFAEALYGVDRVVTTTENITKKFSQELRASIPLGTSVTWLVGAYYTEERTTSSVLTLGADDAGTPAGTLVNFTYDPAKYEEYAAFTNLTFQLTDRFDVQVGGRYSDHEQTFASFQELAFLGLPSTLTTPPAASDTALTYLLTPRFKITSDIMMYARFASGYRPGGPNVLCGVEGVPCGFEPDETQNYDVGIKGSLLNGDVTFDGALYYIDWKNLQLVGIFAPDGFNTYTGNVSDARSRGVELSVSAHPTEGLSVSAWVAYNDAELTEDFPIGSIVGMAGDQLPHTARRSGNLSITQEFPIGSAATATLAGSLSYVGERTGNFRAVPERQRYPSYTQLDLRAGVSYETWLLNFFINNAGDKRGVLRAGLDSLFIPTYATYIQPRTIGVSLTKSF